MAVQTNRLTLRPAGAGLLVAAAVGLAVVPLALAVGDLPRRHLLILLLGACVAAAAFVARRPREVLFGSWVLALTYNRAFFSFSSLVGNHGSQGPYWILSDLLLTALLVLWFYEMAVGKRRRIPVMASAALLYSPLVVALLLSAVTAERVDWVAFELLRFVRVGVLLLYLRYNFDRAFLFTTIAAMGVAVVVQGTLGTLQVLTGQGGVLSIFGVSNATEVYPEQYRAENFYGWVRAAGTMNHPPHLASYFLLTIPILFSAGLSMRSGSRRVYCLGAALVGLAGLACTLSRAPWVLMAVALLAVVVGHALFRISSAERALGRAIAAFCLLGVILIPFADLVAERMTGDFRESIDARMEGYATAFGMWGEHPLTGTGLNNYRVELLEREPSSAWAVASDEIATQQLKVRFTYGPLNLYILLLAEVGVLGLLAFLFFVSGAVVRGVTAALRSSSEESAIYLGAVIGIVALLCQQMIDNSIWVEPILLSLAVVVALVSHGTYHTASAAHEPPHEPALAPARDRRSDGVAVTA